MWSQTGILAALAIRTVAAVPGLAPRRNATQPSAPKAIIFAFLSCPAARPWRCQPAGWASIRYPGVRAA